MASLEETTHTTQGSKILDEVAAFAPETFGGGM
jgi:hypothetical protein